MSKITLDDTKSGFNLSVINQNFDTIAEQFQDKILYRDNPAGEPNQMLGSLDMNSNRILNLPAPVGNSEPVRKQDLLDLVAGSLNIITNGFTQIVDSVASLKHISSLLARTLIVQGYYKAGDFGGGVYNYDPTDITSTDNGGTVLVAIDGARWKLQHSGAVSLGQFGARFDGSDDVAFLNAALQSGIMQLEIPAFASLGSNVVSIPNGMTITGSNGKACGFKALFSGQILFTKTSPSVFTDGYITFSNLEFTSNGFTNISALKFILCHKMNVSNCVFRGCTNPLIVDRGYYFDILYNFITPGNTTAEPTGGFLFTSTVDSDYVFLVNCIGTTHFNNGNGCVAGSAQYFWRRAIDCEVSLSKTFALTDGTRNVYWTIIENDCQNVRYSNSSVENSTSSIIIRTGSGVNVQPSFTKFVNVDCDQAYGGHVLHQSGFGTQFIGGSFTSSGIGLNSAGFFITGGSVISVNGTMVHGYTTGPSGSAFVVQNSDNILLRDVRMNLCYNGVTHGGGCTYLRVENPAFTNSAGGSAYNGSFATLGTKLTGGVGIPNPGGAFGGTTSPTGTTVVNNYGYDAQVFISGGTVTSIFVNGLATGLTSGSFRVGVGESYIINYTAAPNTRMVAIT